LPNQYVTKNVVQKWCPTLVIAIGYLMTHTRGSKSYEN
jgi:hypothetical protein